MTRTAESEVPVPTSDPPELGTMRIEVDGQDVSTLWGTGRLRPYRRRVQLIFQDPYETLNPKHTVGDFVAEPLEVNRIGTRGADRPRRGAPRGRPGGRGPNGRSAA